jgi:hypothetical protein
MNTTTKDKNPNHISIDFPAPEAPTFHSAPFIKGVEYYNLIMRSFEKKEEERSHN